MSKETGSKATAVFDQSAGALLSIGGTWRLTEPFPRLDEVLPSEATGAELRVVPRELVEWDSSLPLFLWRVQGWCARHSIKLNIAALPDNLRELFQIIADSEERAVDAKVRPPPNHPAGWEIRRVVTEWKNSTTFVGQCIIGALELPASPRQFQRKTFVSQMVDAGPKALPIIGLLCFLVGLTFAYETSIQLRRFGLQFYMIGATGTSIYREIGPLIAAILVAGRTGAAFAANIANMKLGNEIDALEMIGVSPISFLVLPRMAALLITMPLTTLYSDFCGTLGPLTIAVGKLDVPITGFLVQLRDAVSLTDVMVGLVKSFVFAVLIGLAGTLRGLQSERTSAGVGRAVTSAVVTGIAAVLVTDALFSPILEHLGF
ncbi:MAG TPA: ABC transporter permease [Verrucomicrobiae bacterium]|jgi:phospholipid/cholesterol/gamma-HCH transport system permease protein